MAPAREHSESQRLRALGAGIRAQRVAMGLTLEDLATPAKLSVTYLGQTERGQRNPSALVLWRIADALGVTLEQLVAPDPGAAPR